MTSAIDFATRAQALSQEASPFHPETIYGFDRWGAGLIGLLPNGHLGIRSPDRPHVAPADLVEIVDSLLERGITTPVLLRVANFLRYRIERINGAFAAAIEDLDYRGEYRGVFPVKVNQQAQVIDRIVEYGAPHHFGLEVGSKAELLIALSHELSAEAAVICNGVKDAEFLRLALMSQRLGYNTFIVLESPRELDLTLAIADEVGVRPQLGVRIKLTKNVSGKWAGSSGDRSTFGMTIAQVMDVIDALDRRGYLDCLVLQHCHLGSQIPNILDIRLAVQEACRFYCEIAAIGAPLRYLDLGGGLGVDYTGEHTASANSVNYTLEEYCFNIVETVAFAMNEMSLEHPIIVTESGRGCVAHSSMLLFNVLEVTPFDSNVEVHAEPDDHPFLSSILAIRDYLSRDRAQECWNDLLYYREQIRGLFRRGQLTLRQAAKAERAHLFILNRIKEIVGEIEPESGELAEALHQASDIYHGNFSLFQSLPDVWAIGQLHPIAPIQRLDETPTRRAVLSDMTCDSDGTVDRFVLAEGVGSTLPVHELREHEEYYLGVFFIGAYQETLGDFHNLFGDTNVVTIELNDRSSFDLLHEQEGDSVAEVLTYTEYSPRRMVDNFKKIVEQAMATGKISANDRRDMIFAFKESMNGYTYFETERDTRSPGQSELDV
jgi:arginine decarboxylase